MKKIINKIMFCLLGTATVLGMTTEAIAAPKKLLVVTVTKGFRHGSIPTAEKVLGQLAKSSGAFEVDYVRNDEDMKTKMTLESLKKLDGVIFANTTGDLPLPDREGFVQWIKSGNAFSGMHSCSDTFHGFPDFVDMLGGEFKTHGAQATVECLNQDLSHPAVRHFGESFTIHDEIYLLKS
ncbi:MAG: ThuA domain-containing protein, partial [Nitrospinaceae bacterium]|nr:ThuA domain-containing protein [Nitrospinaceae bacterium]